MAANNFKDVSPPKGATLVMLLERRRQSERYIDTLKLIWRASYSPYYEIAIFMNRDVGFLTKQVLVKMLQISRNQK